MNDRKFQEAVLHFQQMMQAATLSLEEMLSEMQAGKLIPRKEASDYQEMIAALHQCYDTAAAEAGRILPESILPAAGSDLAAYQQAVTQYNMELAEKVCAVKRILEQFVRVQSQFSVYADALCSYQQQAASLLEQLQDPEYLADHSVDDNTAKPQELFLRGIQETPGDSAAELEKWETLMDEIHRYYPERRIYDGLVARRYVLAGTAAASGETTAEICGDVLPA